MRKKLQSTFAPLAACAWLLLALGAPGPGLAQADGIDAKATSLLRAATTYLGGQARFTTEARVYDRAAFQGNNLVYVVEAP